MQLVVGGYDVTLRTGLLHDLGISENQTPVIRSCWTVTTAHYEPMLIVELDMGLLIVHVSADGAESSATSAGLRWDAIQEIRQDEHTWMLLVSTAVGGELRFLFASLGELHSVATRLASRRAGFLDVDPRDGLRANVDADGGERGVACARPPKRPASARARSRSATAPHEPSPALDRIEQRLATVELLLADLTAGSSGRARN